MPLIIAEITSPEIKFLFLPIVEESIMLSVAPTQIKSSIFMIKASCAIPFQTETSPVSFQYIYAKEDLVPAPSACITKQWSSLPVKWSGTILQNAFGKRPLSIFLIALCTSSFEAETPRWAYLLLASDDIKSVLRKNKESP